MNTADYAAGFAVSLKLEFAAVQTIEAHEPERHRQTVTACFKTENSIGLLFSMSPHFHLNLRQQCVNRLNVCC